VSAIVRRLLILGVGLVSTLGLMRVGATEASAGGYHNPTPTSCHRTGLFWQGHGPAVLVCGGQLMIP
jgi:hypothetical protein